MNPISEQKVGINHYLTGDFPVLTMPPAIGAEPRLFNRPPNSDTGLSLASNPAEQAQIYSNHTFLRLKIRTDLNKEWQSIENLRSNRWVAAPMTKTSDQNNGILSNAVSISEKNAEVKPSINAPFHASPKELVGIGNKYFNGEGVKEDKTVAFTFYQIAAERGDPIAQFHQGFMYFNGHGVKQNYSLSLEWFEKAANQNHSEPPRVLRRLLPLRRWSHEQTNKVSPGAARACDSHGLRAA